MWHQNPPYQDPPQPPASAGELANYRGIAPTLAPHFPAHSFDPTPTGSSFYYILSGTWIGIFVVLAAFVSIGLLSTYHAVVNSQGFPNIRAFHQAAADDYGTFRIFMAMYTLAVLSHPIYSLIHGAMPFEVWAWACVQVYCSAQAVLFMVLMTVWSLALVSMVVFPSRKARSL
jgi:hypothetical protein